MVPLAEHSRIDSSKIVTSKSELVGRIEEMEVLSKILEEAVKGDGGTILIEGEAGVGKTRLVKEFEADMKGQGLELLVGNCIEGGTPYLPFLNALSGLVDKAISENVTGIKETYIIHTDGRLIVHRQTEDISSVDDDVMSSTLTAIRDFIEHSFRPSEDGELKELLFGNNKIVMEEGVTIYLVAVVDPAFAKGLHPQMRRVVADWEKDYGHLLTKWKGELSDELMAAGKLLDDLIGGKYSTVSPDLELASGDKSKIFDSIARMVTKMAKERPLIMFLDDLQWMDPSSLDLLHYLSRVAVEEPVMIIGAYRPEDLVDNVSPDQTHDLVKTIRKLSRERLFVLLRLKRLDTVHTKTMINSIFPKNEFSSGLPERIFKEAKGNPLFTEEVLRELVESRVIFEEEGNWTNVRVEEIRLPSTIKDVVMRRLGRLGEKKTELLQYAASAGQEFSYLVLEKALGWSEADIIEELDELVKLRVLNESIGEDRYTFDHEVLREVLYDSMSRLARRRIHEKIAVALLELHDDDLEPVCFDLANQFSHTRNREQTIRFNLMAGNKALQTGATVEAVKFYEVTLANLEPDVETSEKARKIQLQVFFDLGQGHSLIGDRALALSFFGKALDEARAMEDKETEAKAVCKVADEYKHVIDWDQAMKNYHAALALFEELGNAEGLGEANRGIGHVFWRQGEYEMAVGHLNYSVEIFSREGMKRAMGSALVDLGNVYKTKGDLELCIEKYLQGLEILEKTGDRPELARVHNNLGSYYQDHEKDLKKAREHYSKCLFYARESNDARGIGYSLTGLGHVSLMLDDLDKADEHLDEARKIFTSIGELYMIGGVLHHKGEVEHKRGNHENALKIFDEAIGIFKEKNLRYDIADVLISLGKLYTEMGRKEDAERTYQQCLSIAEEISAMDKVSEILNLMSELN